MSAPICDHGCATAARCTGRCQPPPLDRSKCKWCQQGWERHNGEHWIVKSIRSATVHVVACAA